MTSALPVRLTLAGLVVLASNIAPVGAQPASARATGWQVAAAESLISPHDLGLSDDATPFVDHGHIVARFRDTFAAGRPNVIVFDGSGARLQEAHIWFPGVTKVRLGHAVGSAAGEIIAAGYAITAERGADHFIARAGASGAVTASIHTDPFVPFCICSAQDGTVWALGAELDKADRHEDFAVLRHLAFGSGEVGAYLLRSTFPPGVGPVAVTATAGVGSHQATYLRCEGNRAQLYVNASDEYIDVDPASGRIRRWAVPVSTLGPVKVSGFAVTSAGRVFVSVVATPDVGKRTTGIYEIQTSDTTESARLVVVEGTETGATPPEGTRGATEPQLWGADGEALIVHRPGELGLTRIALSRRDRVLE